MHQTVVLACLCQLLSVACTSNHFKTFTSKMRASFASIAALSVIGTSTPTFAADTVAVGKCLIQNCQKELAQCNHIQHTCIPTRYKEPLSSHCCVRMHRCAESEVSGERGVSEHVQRQEGRGGVPDQVRRPLRERRRWGVQCVCRQPEEVCTAETERRRVSANPLIRTSEEIRFVYLERYDEH